VDAILISRNLLTMTSQHLKARAPESTHFYSAANMSVSNKPLLSGVHTINSFEMGRLHHKNAIVTGAAG
jgi:hypothetical protein